MKKKTRPSIAPAPEAGPQPPPCGASATCRNPGRCPFQTLIEPAAPAPDGATAGPTAEAPVFLLDRARVATALSLGLRGLDRLIASGEFPPADLWIGRSARWKVATVVAWIAALAPRDRRGEAAPVPSRGGREGG